MRSKQKTRIKKVSRLEKLKRRKRKNRLTLLVCSILVVGVVFFVSYKLYIKNKCKDLGYAVEHYFTSNKYDNSLLRVKNMDLVFSDDNTAIVKAYGLSKEEPHGESTIEGMFRKDSLDSWKLESTNLLNNAS